MAQDLSNTGTELPALMTAGRWTNSKMPARYTEGQAAGRGGIGQVLPGDRGAEQVKIKQAKTKQPTRGGRPNRSWRIRRETAKAGSHPTLGPDFQVPGEGR